MASVVISGDTSGAITISAPAVAGTNTLTLPVATDTLVGKTTTDTLTNKTLTSPTLTTPALGTPASGVMTNVTGINYDGFKNRIINGAMVIDQRNAGASVTPTIDDTYTLDRWSARLTAASKYSVRQTPSATETGYATRIAAGFTNYLATTSLATTSLGASDYYLLQQNIEGFNFADMAWGTANAKTITLSFLAYSSLTGTFGGSLLNSASNRSYPFTYSISTANTWTQISVTVAGDTSGTWIGATNGIGLKLYFGLGVGSTYSGTAGSWSGSTYLSATGATSVVGTNGATFYITGVQLEKGSTATSFDYRPYGTELGLCQRYFISIGSGAIGANNGSNQLVVAYAMPVDMRVVPAVIQSGTITVYGPSFSDYNTSTPVSESGSSKRQSIIAFTGASGGSAGIASRTYGTGVLLFNSEL